MQEKVRSGEITPDAYNEWRAITSQPDPFVPLRAYAEDYGATVTWNNQTKTATVTYSNMSVDYQPGSYFSINGVVFVRQSGLINIKNKPGSLPTKGEPNTTGKLYNPDGSLKQERSYGPDGEVSKDVDYNHPGSNHSFPHVHDWLDGDRQDAREPNPGELATSIAILIGVYEIIKFITAVGGAIPSGGSSLLLLLAP